MDLKNQLNEIERKAEELFEKIDNLDSLEALRIEFLGKKGRITEVLKEMAKLPAEEKPLIGQAANNLKNRINNMLAEKKAELEKVLADQRLKEETIDVSLPGKKIQIGHKHPLTLVTDQIKDIFIGLGFTIAEGPEIENEYNNFEALNVPKYHPARDLQDTFYIDDDYLLRTHTSPVQIRTMAVEKPPIWIIAPGRVYRSDDLDASHSPVFHQVEGLVIDKGISFADLKGTIHSFVTAVFGENTKTRFRPSYFPFTEPSAEVDISCVICEGEGCRLCSSTGWLEVMGSGMVHPNVLEMAGIDPREYSGFAFGMGIDRITMLKYGIDDIRLLFTNDKRFLQQF
ncbi:MAG: phenylalanine--tRNA ligase subunit alpha [Halanaerobiaceae bacterium]|nr:phenylalanine--tRNA ligase subunit alpha [Halanaerobiaceae bacterium]